MNETKLFYFEPDPDTTYEGVDAGTWNGWAVPILSDAEYARVKAKVDDPEYDEPYEGTKVDGGWLCDGLCFFIKAEEDELGCAMCGKLVNGETGVPVDAQGLFAREVIACLECAQALSEGKVIR